MRVASGMKMVSMMVIQSSDAGMAFCMGQASEVFIAVLVLPNSSRVAWVKVEIGVQSANTRSGVGRREASMKALETNIRGKESMVAMLLKLAGVRRVSATVAVTQE